MKGLKYFTVFFIYPVALIVIGFMCGVTCVRFFYPGTFQVRDQVGGQAMLDLEAADNQVQKAEKVQETEEDGWQRITGTPDIVKANQAADVDNLDDSRADNQEEEPQEVSGLSQTLNAATSYVLAETDLRNDTIVETSWKLPAKYIGMNREQFLEAMELYEASPPLEELERGFISLEVLSFSPQKVVVQMNYDFVQPGSCFYLMVEDNYVAVYLEDRTTLYMDTDISLKDLPEELQQEIIQVMYVPDEESLYDFLENYTS